MLPYKLCRRTSDRLLATKETSHVQPSLRGGARAPVPEQRGNRAQDFCKNPQTGNEKFSLRSSTCWDFYDHHYIPTQIQDLGPSWEKNDYKHAALREFAKPFWLCISNNNNKDRGRAKQHAP